MFTTKRWINTLCAAALGVGLLLPVGAAQAAAQLTPETVGLTGDAIDTTVLVGGEVSRIDFGAVNEAGLVTWQEHGFLIIDQALLSGSLRTPAGLGSDYTLFISLDLQGVQPVGLPGYTESALVSMYAVQGQSVFGFDDQGVAVATHQGTPVLVASLTQALVSTYSYSDPNYGGALALGALLSGVLVPTSGVGFLSEAVQVSGVFYHPITGLRFINGGASVLITGGIDTLTLSAVPEPAVQALWLCGAALLGGRRLRARTSRDTAPA